MFLAMVNADVEGPNRDERAASDGLACDFVRSEA
jgi:hypothetical protein